LDGKFYLITGTSVTIAGSPIDLPLSRTDAVSEQIGDTNYWIVATGLTLTTSPTQELMGTVTIDTASSDKTARTESITTALAAFAALRLLS